MFRSISNFISQEESEAILAYSPTRNDSIIENEHIRAVAEATNGWTVLCDLTKTEVSSEVAKFQGDTTCVDEVPRIFFELADRIADALPVSRDNVFFQYIVLGSGGKVKKHYDAGKPGYITYKCNICVTGPEKDAIFVGDEIMSVSPLDLYCFEANFYKHWMETSEQPRIHLSYGFLLPYSELGWQGDSSRVRLSNRIWEAYIERRIS